MNGLVERFNRTLYESIVKLTKGQEDWNKHISHILFAYRTVKQAFTRMIPFYLVYRWNPQVSPVYMDKIINENILS